MKCKLVDVFAKQKYAGNGLTIFYDYEALSLQDMQQLTQEMRQFESIFLSEKDGQFSAKIFTMEEELDFAGHPLLGLAYHLHECFGSAQQHEWQVQLNQSTITLNSEWQQGAFKATMNQGQPKCITTLDQEQAAPFFEALSIAQSTQSNYPVEVISTGLSYMILPVIGGLEGIKFQVSDLTPLLSLYGAKFLYVIDINALEGRTWDNEGRVEDIATGSAAGPVGAYLYKYAIVKQTSMTIKQGRFLDRPSQIQVELVCDQGGIAEVKVSGNVVKVADIDFSE
ncbi:MAG: PhzF family phenazine biosynthesis protein [Oceanospirillaceae bacterium]